MRRPRKQPAVGAATHITARAGDRVALCGQRDPLPVVWAPFVPAHVDGYALVLCPACARVLGSVASDQAYEVDPTRIQRRTE